MSDLLRAGRAVLYVAVIPTLVLLTFSASAPAASASDGDTWTVGNTRQSWIDNTSAYTDADSNAAILVDDDLWQSFYDNFEDNTDDNYEEFGGDFSWTSTYAHSGSYSYIGDSGAGWNLAVRENVDVDNITFSSWVYPTTGKGAALAFYASDSDGDGNPSFYALFPHANSDVFRLYRSENTVSVDAQLVEHSVAIDQEWLYLRARVTTNSGSTHILAKLYDNTMSLLDTIDYTDSSTSRLHSGSIGLWSYHDRTVGDDLRIWDNTAPNTARWRSEWWDVREDASISNLWVRARIRAGNNIDATISVNSSPSFDGSEDNVVINLNDGAQSYNIGKIGRYVAVTFDFEGQGEDTACIDNFRVNTVGLPVITGVSADSALIDRDIDHSGNDADDVVDITVRAEIDGPAAWLDNALFSIRDNTDTEVISWAKVSEASATGDNWKEWTYQYNPDDATSDEALGVFDVRVKVVNFAGGQDNTPYTDTDPGGFELFAVDDLSASITLSDPTPRDNLQVSGSASRICGATSLDNAWAVDNSFGEQTMSLEGDSYNLTYQVDSLGGGTSASVYVLVSDGPLDGVSTTLSYTVVNQVPVISNLKTEGLTNPTKVTTATPTFTWGFGDADGDSQQGIHVQVGISEGTSGSWDYQDTTTTAQSIQYAGLALERGITYHVRVRARDNFGEWAGWDNGDSGTFALNRLPVVDNLKTEGLVNPQNLTSYTPNFSWGYSDGDSDVQSHYQVWVGTSEGTYDMWDSGAVASSATSVDYGGGSLQNGAQYYLQIRTKDGAEWGGWTTGTFRINAPPVTQSVRINGDNNYTNSRSVTLAISAADDVSVENMRFSFDGSTWTAWESYSTSKSLTLPENEGVHRIYFKVRDGQDWESDVISDTIVLDLTKPYGMVGVSPIDNAVVGPTTTRFCWTLARDDISGVVSTYTFELAKDSEFTQDLYVAASYKDYIDFPYDNREGASYWRVRVRDRAGNENVTPTYRFIYNPDAPSLTVAAEKTILNTLSASITLSGSNVSAYRYALTESDLDDADWVSYTGAENTLTIGLPAEEGQYRIYFEAQSEAGVTAGPFAVSILLDFTPPQLTLTADNLASENSIRTLGLTGDDGTGSGISQMRVKIGGDNWGPWENYG